MPDIGLPLAVVLGAIAFYAVGVAALVLLWRLLRLGRTVVISMAIVLVAIPWAEQLRARRQFHSVCAHTGLEVLQKPTVDGFLDSTSIGFEHEGLLTNQRTIDRFERSGYRFYERPLIYPEGKVWHLEKIDGQWRVVVLDRPSARYEFARVTDGNSSGPSISCADDVIRDRQERTTIARYTHCKRYPTVLENLVLHYFYSGPVDFCPSGETELKGLLYQQVLVPSKAR